MRPQRARIPVALLALALAPGCASYQRSLVEFDSATGRDRTIEEPDAIEYDADPLVYPQLAVIADWIAAWLGEQTFDLDAERARRERKRTEDAKNQKPIVKPVVPRPDANVDPEAVPALESESFPNPSVLARDRLLSLVARSSGSRYRTAIAANRALWFLALDTYPRNLVIGVDAVAELLARIGVDPCQVPLPGASTPEEEARVARLVTELEKSWPVRRQGATLSSEERASYARVLLDLTRAPLANRRTQRSLVRALAEAERGETDPALLAATAAALDRALAFALATGLRDTLRANQVDARHAREAAMLALYRLGGVAAVPEIVALSTRTRSAGATPARRYDPDPQNRRTLVQICARLQKDVALSARGAGPAPVEFLYEVATADLPELRLVALEALALCLGRKEYFDAVTMDDHAWLDAWWREYAVGSKRTQ